MPAAPLATLGAKCFAAEKSQKAQRNNAAPCVLRPRSLRRRRWRQRLALCAHGIGASASLPPLASCFRLCVVAFRGMRCLPLVAIASPEKLGVWRDLRCARNTPDATTQPKTLTPLRCSSLAPCRQGATRWRLCRLQRRRLRSHASAPCGRRRWRGSGSGKALAPKPTRHPFLRTKEKGDLRRHSYIFR